MARWKPDARERLVSAALELFSEQGFAATTVPQITARAGLTTRTFFRHFADKREVLFAHENTPEQARAIIKQAPRDVGMAEFITWGLRWMAREHFNGRRDELRFIQALIASDAGLQERALRKRETFNALLTETLQQRGLSESQSRLLADTAVSALYIAIDQWLKTDTDVTIDALALEALARLRQNLDGIEAAQ